MCMYINILIHIHIYIRMYINIFIHIYMYTFPSIHNCHTEMYMRVCNINVYIKTWEHMYSYMQTFPWDDTSTFVQLSRGFAIYMRVEGRGERMRRHEFVQYHHHALQRTAICCNTLKHSAAHCNTLQHTATHLQFCNIYEGRGRR